MSNNQNRPPQPPAPQPRDPRELESRAAEAREQTWAPPETLPEIVRQDGYVYRWIRTAINGEDDPMNVSRSTREHWSPVSPDEQPQMRDFFNPRAAQKGSIEIGGLLLCKCPEKIMKQRDAYYAGRAAQEQKAINENLMKENDSRMPLFNQQRSKVVFGNGGGE